MLTLVLVGFGGSTGREEEKEEETAGGGMVCIATEVGGSASLARFGSGKEVFVVNVFKFPERAVTRSTSSL